MTFSQYAGTAIVPTLARLVLAAVFVIAGWNKVFKDAEFTADQATTLRNLGVNVEPVVAPASAAITASNFALASYRQDQSSPPATPPATPPASPPEASPATDSAAANPPVVPTTTAPAAAGQTLPPGMYKAQALHHVTLMLDANNFPYPVWQARLAAFTELVGGAMLLLGLFSRIWGLGLSIAMGVAFYLVSNKMNNVLGVDPRTLADTNPMAMATASLQVSLFVLAFGILLTGAGPLSLDRMLFGGGGDELEPKGDKID